MLIDLRARYGRFTSRGLAALALAAVPLHPTLAAEGRILSFAEALRIAVGTAPQLGAQEAATRSAREGRVGADQLPDPKLIAGIENLPVEGSDKFSLTRDFMTMRKIGVMQDITGSEKLRLRGQRADAEIRREEALLEASRLNVRKDTAIAWVDAWYAERQLELLVTLERETALQLDAAQAALAGGKARPSDAIAARQSAAQLADRVTEAKRLAARARAQLARWIGPDAQRPLGDPPRIDVLPVGHARHVGNLDAHPHLQMFPAMQAVADAEVRLAEAAKSPDWSVEVSYAQRGPAYTNMISVGVRIDLPIFEAKRQSPAIAAKLAAAEQVRAQAEDARRMLAAEIASQFADWQSAQERVRRYETLQLPLALERSEAVLASYRGGQGDLMTVIDARKGEVEARLGLLQVRNEQARTWAQLSFQLRESGSREAQ